MEKTLQRKSNKQEEVEEQCFISKSIAAVIHFLKDAI